MRSILYLLAVLCIWAQVTAQRAKFENELNGVNDFELIELINSHGKTELRNLNDLKDKIKKSILVAWETFKVIANNTNAKIKAWVEKVKEKINKASKTFIERLDKLKNEFNDVVSKITVTGDNLKTCLKEHRNTIKNIFNEIVSNVKNCISRNVKNISHIETSHALLSINNTIVLAGIHNELSKICKEDNVSCLSNVHNEFISEIENAAQNVSQKFLQARDAIDERLENALLCITEGLMNAAKTIVNETVQIIQCVKNKGGHQIGDKKPSKDD